MKERAPLPVIAALDVDLGEIDHPLLEEIRRLAQTSPRGQERILSIDQLLVFGQASWLFDLAMR